MVCLAGCWRPKNSLSKSSFLLEGSAEMSPLIQLWSAVFPFSVMKYSFLSGLSVCEIVTTCASSLSTSFFSVG